MTATVLVLVGSGCGAQSTASHPGGGLVVNSSGYVNADAVLVALENGGWPVGEGYPTGTQFQTLRGKTRCSSSKTFVRTDVNRGWGFICLGMPADLYTGIRKVFDNALVLMGPLYLDSGPDLVIFGFGWPTDTSQKFAKTLGTTGMYLLPPNS